jgi:long-chain acyl-CoA synthetase
MNLAQAFVDSAVAHADRIAVRTATGAMTTYAELDDLTARAAGVLTEAGVGVGDRVGVMLPNVPEFAVTYYGTLRAGAVVVPMNPLLKAREVAHYLGNSGAKLIFATPTAADEVRAGAPADCQVIVVDQTFAERLAAATPMAEVPERVSDDTAVILYTSGTTGLPKGAELTHANLMSNAELLWTDLVAMNSQDVVFGGLPLFHVFGQTCGLNASMLCGASIVLLPRFDAATAESLILGQGITIIVAVPTMFTALAEGDPIAAPALRIAASGGAALPVEVLARFDARWDCTVLEGYGLSETSPCATFNHLGRPRKVGSVGEAVRGVEVCIFGDDGKELPIGEVGEIAVRGENVMKGYWNAPEATAKAIRPDGWFLTGDLGREDEDGYFFIVDRKKDLIIRGGYNVYPRELEEVFYEHPDVIEVAVIGIPHPTHGEEVGAAVVVREGSTTTADDLRTYLRERVAAYKYPREVWLLDTLPKGPTGKILKRMIDAPVKG